MTAQEIMNKFQSAGIWPYNLIQGCFEDLHEYADTWELEVEISDLENAKAALKRVGEPTTEVQKKINKVKSEIKELEKDNFIFNIDTFLKESGIGKFEVKDSFSKGDDEKETILYFEDHNIYLRIYSWDDSYGSDEYQEWMSADRMQVFPEEVTVTVYKNSKEKEN